jgi:TPR repeat protein
MVRLLFIVAVSVVLFTACVKKADRVANASSSSEKDANELREKIYTQAQAAKEEGNTYRSVYLHEKNCGLGYSKSCNRLAYQHYVGEAIIQNHERAFFLYGKSCKMKNKYGCFNLGNMLRLGHGTKTKEFGVAFGVYKDNCADNCYRSCFNMAVMYFKGQGVDKNVDEATKFFKKACDGGVDLGCKNYLNISEKQVNYLEPADVDK